MTDDEHNSDDTLCTFACVCVSRKKTIFFEKSKNLRGVEHTEGGEVEHTGEHRSTLPAKISVITSND